MSYEELFYRALRIRLIEEAIIEIYPSDKIQSPVHLSIGQEHHIVSFIENLKLEDKIFTTYRNHGVYLAKDGDLKLMFAELYGKIDGISKGKAGSMHLTYPKTGVMGSSAIVGAIYSHATGFALSQKIKKEDSITVAITGEGATEEGTFCECLNFASLKSLPIIFLIENNGLAINIPLYKRENYKIKNLAEAFNLDYFHFANGFEFENINRETDKIVQSVRENQKPTIIEIDTYRYKEHVGIGEDYDKGYRDISELKKWQDIDPLIQDRKLIEKFTPKIEKEIEEAMEFAENSPFATREELLKDVL